MKKIDFKFSILLMAFLFTILSETAFSQSTILNYSFNSGTSFSTLVPITAEGITSSVTGTGNAATFSTTTGNATSTLAFTSNSTAGNALRVANSYGSYTSYWTYALSGCALSSTTGIKVYLQAKKATYGATTIKISYSTNGSTFTDFPTTMAVTTSFTEKVFDLSSITALNNQSNIYIKVSFSGATQNSTSASLYIDNFQILGNVSCSGGSTSQYWSGSGSNVYLSNSANFVGIGTTNPIHPLQVNGNISIDGLYSSLNFGQNYPSTSTTWGQWGIEYEETNGGLNFWKPFGSNNFGNYFLFLKDNGNVLIGKNTQVNSTYKLDVAGSIRANEIVVNTDGADFVFDKNYKLMSLTELENSLLLNKHLPGIPSASEMQEKGMSVGQTNTLLLQKIEELTLYIIEQNKRITELEKKVQD